MRNTWRPTFSCKLQVASIQRPSSMGVGRILAHPPAGIILARSFSELLGQGIQPGDVIVRIARHGFGMSLGSVPLELRNKLKLPEERGGVLVSSIQPGGSAA
jgi:hypothetical protein